MVRGKWGVAWVTDGLEGLEDHAFRGVEDGDLHGVAAESQGC